MKEQVVVSSKLGDWLLTGDQNFLYAVDLIKGPRPVSKEVFSPVLKLAGQQLQEYFTQQRQVFTIPIKYASTFWQETVWGELLKIPYGEVRSYQALALAGGKPTAARAVGQANHRNPLSIIVPCHRVLAKNGQLVGFGNGIEIQKQLLELEGHRFIQRKTDWYLIQN